MGCPYNKSRLFQLKPIIFDPMAQKLKIDVDFLIGLSAYETGWLSPPSPQQHNLFGISDAIGQARSFATYQDCANQWLKYFGQYVAGAATSNDFVSGLRRAKYNSENPVYYGTLSRIIAQIPADRKSCGAP
jgi:hypothetical protein